MSDHMTAAMRRPKSANGISATQIRRIKATLRGALYSFAIALSCVSYPALAKHPHLRVVVHDNDMVMLWAGKIKAPMSAEIAEAFELNKDHIKAVELKLDSGGGSVKEGEDVIRVLQDIKKTHKLVTAVAAGKRCGSMCVFIYVQGDKRLAASASLWLFHEVSVADKRTHKITRLDRARWEELVQKYWVPAGVSQVWIDEVKAHTNESDYWQSGESLLRSNANLIHKALPDEKRRKITPVESSDARARQP